MEETWTYTATLTVDQANFDKGGTIESTAIFDSAETDEDSDTAESAISQTPGFTISNEINPTSLTAPGELTYKVTVENTGNVSLTKPSLSVALAQNGTPLDFTSRSDTVWRR